MYGGVRLMALVRRLPRGGIHGNFVTSLALSSPRVPQAYVNGASLFSTGTSLPQRKYTKRHEWISMKSGGKDERVGVTNYAQDALGDIVFVQLPDVGTEVKRYQECGALESVKAASDVYAPLDGKVTSVNPEVESSPGLLNSSPYDKGWLFTLTVQNIKDYDLLMDEEQYKKFLEAEKPI